MGLRHWIEATVGGTVLAALVMTGFSGGTGNDPLPGSMLATGSQLKEARVEAWAEQPGGISREGLELVVGEMVSSLGVQAGMLPDAKRDGALYTLKFNTLAADGSLIKLTAQSLAPVPGTALPQGSTYLRMEVTPVDGLDGLAKWKDMLNKGFALAGFRARLSTYLTGVIPGRLSEGEMIALAEQALEVAGAGRVEGVVNYPLVSLTGYTPRLPDYVWAGSQRLNINVALRYHASEDATFVEVGSPLLDGEY